MVYLDFQCEGGDLNLHSVAQFGVIHLIHELFGKEAEMTV